MVSIYDIAEAANVSTATVSRALANSDLVSAATKERILKLADEMGYRPNLVARNFRQQSTSFIGLILDDISDELGGTIAKGVEDEMKRHGRFVIIWNAMGDIEREKAALEFFDNLKMEGVILADTTVQTLESMPEIKMPSIFINRMHSDKGSANYVGANDFQGAFDATSYLIELQHRRIGYINGPAEWGVSLERLNGYMSALKQGGIDYDPELVAHGDWYEKTGYQHAKMLIQLPDRPSAIFASSDMMAIGVMDAARELGMRIPEDLSVMGYDNRMISRYCRPSLTTISLPFYEVGIAASRALIELIDGKNEMEYNINIRVRGKIILRETTARYPSVLGADKKN